MGKRAAAILTTVAVMVTLTAVVIAPANADVAVSQVADLNIGGSSGPSRLIEVNGTLFFAAHGGGLGRELYSSDGTAEGTGLLKEIRSGIQWGLETNEPFVDLNGLLLFAATDGDHGVELWRSDGTESGTVMVKDINTLDGVDGHANPTGLTVIGDTVFFAADDGVHGVELWSSDGTTAGTQLVKNIRPESATGPLSSSPTELTVSGGTLFFSANTGGTSAGGTGRELWRSDGTEAGTVLVKDIRPTGGSDPLELTDVAGTLFFRATASTGFEVGTGTELWSSDGTEAGTVLVKDINPTTSSFPNELTAVGDILYFAANDGTSWVELWKSDGTGSGTVLVKDIHPGSLGSFPRFLTEVDGEVFFQATDGQQDWYDEELWKSDGTAGGTVLVKDIEPGPAASEPRGLFNWDGTLYFSAERNPTFGGEGTELWSSDGTTEGTVLVADINPTGSSFPSGFTVLGETMYFSADDGVNGAELWQLEAGQPSTADLQVTLAPDATAAASVGHPFAYTASITNAGPDPVAAQLTVEPQYHDQASWGAVPDEAIINGVFFLEVPEIGVGETVEVPFEVVFDAFGDHGLTATVAGVHDETAPGNDAATLIEVVDLPLDTPGVEPGGLDVGAADTTDAEPLALVGVRVPSDLVAGDPGWDLLVPSALTPDELLAADCVGGGTQWSPGNRLRLAAQAALSGSMVLPSSSTAAFPDVCFAPDPGDWLEGRAAIPPRGQWNPSGRLLLRDRRGPGRTDALVGNRPDTTLLIGRGQSTRWNDGLEVEAEGGVEAGAVQLCGTDFGGRLGHGDKSTFKCGSLSAETLTGTTVIELDDGTLVDVPAGATVQIIETDPGVWEVTAVEGSGITVTVAGQDPATLDEGDIWPPADVNQPPVAAAGGPYLGAINTAIPVDGSASEDPDGDPLTYNWTAAVGSFDDPTSPSPTFTATDAGIYVIALEVCDPSASCDSAQTSVVVYDPAGGFVTGGGWLDSAAGSCGPAAPAGVCTGDPVGRASFGFVSKYKKGAAVPTGNTAFVFDAGGLEFASTDYEWLVVAGRDRAQFKGSGTINDQAGFSFMVTAYDGKSTGSPDGFRIKIWTADGVVYDNRAGLDDEPAQANTQAINGGSIVIHRK